MVNVVFIFAIALFFTVLFYLGFRCLPAERWQVMACIPTRKNDEGLWKGFNLTYYGFFNALAYAVGLLLIFTLLGSVGVPLVGSLVIAAVILGACIPAATFVARAVERKRFVFSVGGASFVGIILAPWAIIGTEKLVGESLGFSLPLYPVLAAFAIAYAVGEGTGRLACISYGCCYGKPLGECGPLIRKLFRNHSFVFTGKNKKIAYASQLDGREVIPIQAVTSIIFILTALAGLVLFINGWFYMAFLSSLVITQAWRYLSEFLRADYRGGYSISPYQVLSLVALVYASTLFLYLPQEHSARVDILNGLQSLWNPTFILILELIILIAFIHTGRSGITASSLRIFVREDRT